MKRIIQITCIAITFAIGSATLIGCGNSNEQQEQNVEEHDHTTYSCPMKCEGDKTYNEEGTCHECGMDLVLTHQ